MIQDADYYRKVCEKERGAKREERIKNAVEQALSLIGKELEKAACLKDSYAEVGVTVSSNNFDIERDIRFFVKQELRKKKFQVITLRESSWPYGNTVFYRIHF